MGKGRKNRNRIRTNNSLFGKYLEKTRRVFFLTIEIFEISLSLFFDGECMFFGDIEFFSFSRFYILKYMSVIMRENTEFRMWEKSTHIYDF